MFKLITQISALLLLLLTVGSVRSEIFWVGNSTNCTGSNVRPSLTAALLNAGLNSTDDEIRLTGTLSYTGGGNAYTLTNFEPGSNGALRLVGGYSDCFTSAVGRTAVGNVSGTVFTVNATAGRSASVTFVNLQIQGGTARGLVVNGNADVVLENSRVFDNDAGGVQISGGGFVHLKSNSVVEDNGVLFSGDGGGVHCSGSNSALELDGDLRHNKANRGGNLYLASGCFAALNGGASIDGVAGSVSADRGAGVYINNGGELFGNGGAARAVIKDNTAFSGGGLLVTGSGRATLINTVLLNNQALDDGAAIFASNGGTSQYQLVMDRTGPCPFLISCSEIEGGFYDVGVVFITNSKVQINRSIIELAQPLTGVSHAAVIHAQNNSVVHLNRVGILRNVALSMIQLDNSTLEAVHLTGARNTHMASAGGSPQDVYVLEFNDGSADLRNSLFQDTRGLDFNLGSLGAVCNLVDDTSGWGAGVFLGTAQFNNIGNGDARQLAASPGVDMCVNGDYPWSAGTLRDIEYQLSPVNENTNPQGAPGHSSGLYDAGFDEVYDNIGPDEFLLSVQKTGSGNVLSTPLGIACGVDCSEVFFNGTGVTLFAVPESGHRFDGWSNCPMADDNECQITVTQSTTITAHFVADDLIFADAFE